MTPQTYSDSAEGVTITKARALRELDRHGVSDEAPQFLADCGDCAEYDAGAVLAWLGY
jgi:hypothetical protein